MTTCVQGRRHQATLQALLDAGASTALADRSGRTPLTLALARGRAGLQRDGGDAGEVGALRWAPPPGRVMESCVRQKTVMTRRAEHNATETMTPINAHRGEAGHCPAATRGG